MARAHEMGSKLDIRRHESWARIDDESRQRKVRLAREMIYLKGLSVTSSAVEKLLQPESLVPTKVSSD